MMKILGKVVGGIPLHTNTVTEKKKLAKVGGDAQPNCRWVFNNKLSTHALDEKKPEFKC